MDRRAFQAHFLPYLLLIIFYFHTAVPALKLLREEQWNKFCILMLKIISKNL